MAGVPFDVVEKLATPLTARLVRSGSSEARIAACLQEELPRIRSNLWSLAKESLSPYLVFAGGGVRELLTRLLEFQHGQNLGNRNAKAGDRERHLLLYLQRVATKNDTFGQFGPSAWGKIDEQVSGVALRPEAGIARRDLFMERWTAHAVAALAN